MVTYGVIECSNVLGRTAEPHKSLEKQADSRRIPKVTNDRIRVKISI